MVKHREYTGIANLYKDEYKNPKRIAAGKRVWAKKSAAEKAAIIARLKAGRHRVRVQGRV